MNMFILQDWFPNQYVKNIYLVYSLIKRYLSEVLTLLKDLHESLSETLAGSI